MKTPAEQMAATAETVRFLAERGIAVKRRWDGAFFVPGDVGIHSLGLTELPDFSQIEIVKGFYCYGNQLTSLKGAPRAVGGTFNCHDNKLDSLEHGPVSVGASYYCDKNRLTSLEHAPREVPEVFDCAHNLLETLEGAPRAVGCHFFCEGNRLTSLKGMPETVGGGIICAQNRLRSLKRLPRFVTELCCQDNDLQSLEDVPDFELLCSDFGEFRDRGDIPKKSLLSDATKLRRANARQAFADARATSATVLRRPLTVGAPLRLRPRGSP